MTGCATASSGAGHPGTPAAVTPTPSPPVSTEWTEYHRDASRAATGPDVPVLASPKVGWRAPVDGDVYASPLIAGGHVIVATENDTVYSLDLFTGDVLWKTHLGTPVAASTLPCGDIGPVTGITGTPAIDLAAGRVFVVAYVQPQRHMMFVLNLVDGSVVSSQVVDPQGSTPSVQQQRGALAIGPAYVYIPLGGLYGDCGPYHGYVVAVPRDGGGQGVAYRVPSARGAGIWSTAGVTLDSSGNVYAVTGNGASRSAFDFSNAVVELSADMSRVESYFAPADWIALNVGDTDLGALGVTLLPSAGLAVAVGKDGVAYALRAGRLGGVGGQLASRHVCSGAFGGTASSGAVVYVPCRDGLYALRVSSASVDVVWHSAHPVLGSPILAAGEVWGIDEVSSTLYALDPSTGHTVYSVGLGASHHFNTPAATEGFVVAPAGREVVSVVTLGG